MNSEPSNVVAFHDSAAAELTRVRAWFEDNAPKKGAPDDFSSLHIVSADTAEEYRTR